jgi:hypothetical protein
MPSALNQCSVIALIGKLTNGNFICLGMVGVTGSAYTANQIGMDTTAGKEILIQTLDRKFTSATGKLYKQNVIIVYEEGNVVENLDGSLATIPGLFNASHSLSNTTALKGANFYLSSTGMYKANSSGPYLKTCLFAEL